MIQAMQGPFTTMLLVYSSAEVTFDIFLYKGKESSFVEGWRLQHYKLTSHMQNNYWLNKEKYRIYANE